MNIVRWGMIGCGAVTEVKSGPAFQLASGSVLSAVASRNFASAQDYARRHCVAVVHEHIDDLISSDSVDAVYIATPPASHMDLALKVARAGKPCCVEKPMALDHRECMLMIEAFAARDLPLFVSYYRRSLPRFRAVKAWLDEARIGAIRDVRWHLARTPTALDRSGVPNWRTDPVTAPGGYFDDLASHGIDLLQFLLGDIVEARGIATNQLGLYRAVDTVTACWRFAQGAVGSGSWNFAAGRREDEVRITGANGRIRFPVFDDAPIHLLVGDEEHAEVIDHPAPIQLHHVENMVRQLTTGVPHPSPGVEAAKTNWVMAQILDVGKRLQHGPSRSTDASTTG